MNTPYAPFPALLCFSASYILSPSSTNPTGPIDTETGDLVGTGPFVYDGLIPDFATNFHAFKDYWRGKADIETMRFLIITDSNARINALLTGIIDFLGNPLPSLLPILKVDPNITVLDSGTWGGIYYLGMNNKQINKTWRQAVSYSVNYSYIIEVITENQTVRLKSPIPDGILYANDSFNCAIFNLTHARLIMQSMGFGVGFDIYNDAEWETAASNAPFRIFNYSYINIYPTHAAILPLLQDNLGKIGINVTDAGMSNIDFYYRQNEIGGFHRDMLQLYFTSWGVFFNDPSNYINLLMTNRTIASNGAQINDSYLQDLMEEGLNETDPALRKGIYEEIQRYCVEDLIPWAFCYTPKLYHAHYKDFTGFQQNAMGKVYFYPCQWSRRLSRIEISQPSDISYFKGVTGNNITWTITTDYVLNPVYYIYVNSSLNQTTSWTFGVPIVIDIDSLPVGTYEYRIEVHNGDEIIEDIVIVTVEPLGTEITHPSDITYFVGVAGNNITWTITADYVLNPVYNIYRNDLLNQTNSWESGVPVVINIDGLSVNTYEYRIEVHNGDKILEDIVIVIVNSFGTEITHPSDITYVEGETGSSISWTITADYILDPEYFIYRNSSLIETNSWGSGVAVIIDVDGLSVGSYEYQIEVHNGDEIVEDTVIVTVNHQPIIPGYPLEFLIALSFVIFYFLQKKIRRHPTLESDLANNKKNIF